MEYLFLVGRVLYGGFFLLSGIDHFRRTADLTAYASAKGIPAPKAAVLISGLAIIGGGLSMILGSRPTWGVLLLVIFLVPVSFSIHNFWAVDEPQARQFDTIQFKKNMALLGGALMLLLIPQPWPLSLGW